MYKTETTYFIQSLTLLCFLLLFSFSLTAQSYPEKNNEIKFSGNHYYRINDTLYACEIEVTNKDYKEFLGSLSYDEYEKCKIDSSLWKTNLNFPDSHVAHMVRLYHIHPAFDLYPVVNNPYYGAIKYCEWLTMRYKKSQRKDKVSFELPTEQEWVLLSKTNPATKLPYNLLDGKNKNGRYLENIKAMSGDTVSFGADGGYYPVRTDAYWANSFGLYNVIGNVAEMTNIEDVQKGGSWFDDLQDCLTDKVQTYATPDPRVGFRVVAIVKRR